MSGPPLAPPSAPGGDADGPLRPTTVAWLVALLGWTALLCFYDLGGGARFEPIDCWVAQTAREMLDADEWLVPTFSGETRMQKSPGPYWAVMLAALVRGSEVDEIAARIPNGIAALVLVATIFWLTWRMAGQRAAIFAGFATSASTLMLWWSHRGASDLGLTTFTTLSLAALWVAAECEPPGRKRNRLFLLGYFAAGLGMIYKMPMPLAVVGVPAVLYVLLLNRWRIFAHPVHLLGLLVFLLPWLPWAIAVALTEEAAAWKWKVEYIDRFTGDLPNVKGQDDLKYLAMYLVPPVLYCLPFSLSLPGALVRGFQKQAGVRRSGTLFMVIWFLGLLAFFTASTGKEWRYFLPALPPLFVLLGIELAAFFDPQRPQRAALDRFGLVAVLVLVPGGLIAAGFGLNIWWNERGAYELAGAYEWIDVLIAYGVTAALITVGCIASAVCYVRRREHVAFGMLVLMMYATFLWTWPKFVPLVMSQRPFIELSERLRDPDRVPPSQRADIRHIGTQDSRIIWYSDLRIPRLIDQLELLEEQDGQRDLEYEKRRYGEEMIEALGGDERTLLLASLPDYLEFINAAPPALAEAGRDLPPLHLWLQTRYGRENVHFVLFGNRPPPFTEPELRLSEEVRANLARKGRWWTWPPPPDAELSLRLLDEQSGNWTAWPPTESAPSPPVRPSTDAP